MSNFASGFARLIDDNMQIVRFDWRSHGQTRKHLGLNKQWSEFEWTGSDADSLVVRGSNSKAIRAALLTRYGTRDVLLSKHKRGTCPVTGIAIPECNDKGEIVSLSGVELKPGCGLSGLQGVTSLDGLTMAKGCELFDLHNVTSLDGLTMAQGCLLSGLRGDAQETYLKMKEAVAA